MNALVKKIAAILPELEARGPVYLFAFAEREDVNRWDVMLSSSWSDEDYAAAVRVVADALTPRLEPSEMTVLARVVIIPSDAPTILDMPQSLEEISPGSEKMITIALDDADLRRTFVFKACRPPRRDLPAEMADSHTAYS